MPRTLEELDRLIALNRSQAQSTERSVHYSPENKAHFGGIIHRECHQLLAERAKLLNPSLAPVLVDSGPCPGNAPTLSN